MSLKRFLAIWLLGGLVFTVLLMTGIQAVRAYSTLAGAQDQALKTAVRSAGTADTTLQPYPWPDELDAAGGPVLFFSHVNGQLVRTAARRLPDTAPGQESIVVQVAGPLRDRLPGPADLVAGSLVLFYTGLALYGAIAALGAGVLVAWLRTARQSLANAHREDAVFRGPREFAAAFEQARQLHRGERRWIEEQRHFLAEAAHQLRTPMAVLRTQLQSAIDGSVPAQQSLAGMLDTVDRATDLANQLLSLTKLEQVRRSGALRSIPMAGVLHQAIVELSPLIAKKRLDFQLEGGDTDVTADAVMLGELVRNLLANAIHHSRSGGRLGVHVRTGLPWTELVVWDEGEGIDDAVKPRLFTPFSASKGGVGLGLSICQQIAESMGATVKLFNRHDADHVVGVNAVVAWRGSAP